MKTSRFVCVCAVAALAAVGEALPEVWVGDAPLRVERVGFERIRLNGKDVTAEFYAKNWW